MDNEELLTDIVACFNNDSWILIDPYGPTEDEELQQTWWQFNDGVCRLKQKGLVDEKIWAQYAKRLEEIVGVVRTNMKDLIISGRSRGASSMGTTERESEFATDE